MIRFRFSPLAVALLCIAALLAVSAGSGAAACSVAVYHDPGSRGILFANLLLNLAAHFSQEICSREVDGYQAGDLADLDAAIYVGTAWGRPLPEAFLQDAGTGAHRLLWLGCNFDQLTDYLGGPGSLGFEYDCTVENDGRDRIWYKGREMERDPDDLFYHAVCVTGACTVISELIRAGHPESGVPHCVQGGELFFIAEHPFYSIGQDDRYWVLADLLHEFFDTGIPEQRLAMARFEDLAPGNVDPAILKQVSGRLFEMDAPFSFGVIPVYREGGGVGLPSGFEARLPDDPEFLDAIDFMLDHGGTMVMHGVTHQHGDQTTGNGWEFWDDETGAPLARESEQWARERIEWGLEEFASVGFRPRIWETPHYAASHGVYLVVSEYFQTMYERPRSFDIPPDSRPAWGYAGNDMTQILPYHGQTSVYRMGNLPETLGYIDPDKNGPEDLLDIADRLSIVRDGVASFYFHHMQVPPDTVYGLVEELQQRGYVFVGPDAFVDHETDPRLDDDDDDTGDDDDDADDDDDDVVDEDDDESADSDDDGCGCRLAK